MIRSKTPTTETFASNLFRSATRLEYVVTVRSAITNGVEVNDLGSNFAGMTALCWATRRQNPLLVQLLLDPGADPNVHTEILSTTPLQEAILSQSNLMISQMLIDKGANVNGLLDMGKT